MKKILFAAFAATLLAAGCQKTEVIHQVGPTDGSLMSFSTEMSKLTKSTPPATPDANSFGMYNLRAQEFKIWAYCDYNDPNTTTNELNTIYDGMANLNIAYDKSANEDDGTWKPGKEYYWPSTGKYLRFFAVSGAGNSTVTPSMTVDENATTTSDPKLIIANYTVNHSSPNTDLMVADFIRQDKSTNNKCVEFNFRHALSKVQFMFKTESGDTPVFIQSLTVENIKTTGTLTVTENTGNDKEIKPILFAWVPVDNTKHPFSDDYTEVPSDFPAQSELEPLSPSSGYDNTALQLTSTATEFATWLVLPQEIVTKDDTGAITSGYKVRVTYVIGKRQFEAFFPLYKTDLEKWNDNQYTKYLVTITPNKITFEAQAKDWAPYDGDGDNKTGSAEDNDNDNKDDDIHLQNYSNLPGLKYPKAS